ncbi:iron complex transport system substrate-binding protein [Micromonospora pisi]|uniref:Iron complex transport system substrate-binding protein n=1 Tax=Micromonospora pisi TaxID=589240 RepID=A0A495JCZ8_9ACTN|nr:ABC transporter substrate-binding protein [Micromonospora pisi]RKR86232.1 iron complex transport system substrate-binding protein [Micromonospora pisi]
MAMLAVAGTAACGTTSPAQDSPATTAGPVVVTNCGLPLTVAAPPRRAVALEQNATEIMLSLGLADRMAGTSYQTDPVLPELRAGYEKVPVLAKLYPSREALRAANPDFVYSTYASAYASDAAGARKELGDLGVPAYLSPFSCEDPSAAKDEVTFDGIFAEIGDIATIFGVPDRGEQVVAAQRARLDAAKRNAGTAPDTSLLWYYSGTKTPYVAGHGGLPDTISSLLGARNAFTDAQQKWPAGNWEEIAQRNPDIIVLADLTRGGEGDSAASKIEFLRSNPVTAKLDAVVHNRFITVSGSSMDPSVRSVTALEQVSAGLRANAPTTR